MREKFFPPPPEADLADIDGTAYPPSVGTATTITREEVERAIRRPAADKAPGISQIPNRALRAGMSEILTPAHHLFNACIKLGYHPKLFKRANTIVLRKPNKEDYFDPKAYRPIALLDTLGKALESVVAMRISDLAEQHQLLPVTQMGGRRQRSAETALELLVEQVHTIWGCGKENVATVLSLDVAGAFDHVNHKRLIHNLRKRHIPEYLTNWVASFLSDRTTTLTFNGKTTALLPQ